MTKERVTCKEDKVTQEHFLLHTKR